MTPLTSIAHYRITSKLGEGGMGAVYRATDTKLSRDVAIKVLPDSFAQDPDRLARFKREAQVLASLNHPNIAAIYGVEDRALVLELVEGPTLADRIAQGPIPLDEALAIAGQIADGVEYAHDRGVIHRDLKPANIKVTPDGRVKILDFGLAKALAEDSAAVDPASSPTMTMRATMAGAIMGTAGYMSPEQARGKPAGRRSDVWSFGVVLWEMVTGRQLFGGETVSDILAQVLTREPDLEAAPASLRPLLRACLERDPSKRLRSVGDWRLLVAGETAAAPAKKQVSWAPWAIAAALAVLAGWFWWRQAGPTASAPLYTLSVVPPDGTTYSLDATNGMLEVSPDGRNLAFVGLTDGVRRVWVRPLDSPTARSLAGTENADGVFWSPDSRHLGVIGLETIKRVDLATGTVKQVCQAVAMVRGASWSADGTILFGVVAPLGIFRVPAEGGAPVLAATIDRKIENNQNWPQSLPDGKHFIYWVRGVHPDGSGMVLGSLDDPKLPHRTLLATPSAARYVPAGGTGPGHLLFQRGRTLLAQPFDAERLSLTGSAAPVAEDVAARAAAPLASASHNGVLAFSGAANAYRVIAIVSRDGKLVRTLGDLGNYLEIRLSRDGRTLGMAISNTGNATFDIWSMDLDRAVPVRLTNDSFINLFPILSPDQKDLLFSSSREGLWKVYRKRIGGASEVERLPLAEGASIALDWSADGKSVLSMNAMWTSASRLAILPLAGGDSATVDVGSPSYAGAMFSPSGRWIAYSSRESGAYEIYVKRVAGAAEFPKIRISRAGGLNPAWSGDDRELYFTAPDGRLMAAKVNAASDRFEAGEPEALFQTGGYSSYNAAVFWAPIGNGQQFVVLRSAPVTERENRLTVVTNWEKALKEPR
jgi:Tol biopolymer transport system component